ncbi:nuclear protein MDM1 isoform X7 [Zophobas morio]|uniref:nuclear protein MDM1 isoform X7 n=1 Tax=Zophobas morio TaxID=2755281 RepID=UPI00308369CE
MIGSFWNLCRACPSMPVDKLHSEYRSTYRWHEYTGPRQEVVRRPPQPNAASAAGEKANDTQHSSKQEDDVHNELPKLEPAMPRRKKYPDLAYRHHEFLISDGEIQANGVCNTESRARSEERGPHWRPSRRSKSEGPRCGAHGDGMRERERRRESDPDLENMDEFNTEYKKKFRPFSQYEYSEGRFTKRGGSAEDADDSGGQNSLPPQFEKNDSWYREVVELRKKAGEYKHRGWGSELAPDRLSDIYNKQVELWDQVSRRSSLSALSLASMTHKSYTKEEKEVDNNNKTSPSKAARNAENSARIMRDMIRHHLERTTGGSELDGLILSPTREKLEPTIPRKDDDSRGSQKNSPKKNSPLKSSSLKRHNQKASSKGGPKNLRSQSVGPITDTTEKRSPKRQSRSATVKERKSSANQASIKRPRPSSLNTTASSRSKPSSVTSKNEDDRLAKAISKSQITNDFSKQKLGSKQLEKGSTGAEPPKAETTNDSDAKNTTAVEGPEIIDYEPVVKSPPEPTRVKSPEQILMRSPDPVNWTVPLDTGKTFTVTQNVREGDISSRPHSEVKAWTPPDVPPPIAQSAPPTLTDQNKEQGMDLAVKA